MNGLLSGLSNSQGSGCGPTKKCCNNNNNGIFGGNGIILIIILLCFCGGGFGQGQGNCGTVCGCEKKHCKELCACGSNNSGCGGFGGFGSGNGSWWIIIILLLCFCGGNNRGCSNNSECCED